MKSEIQNHRPVSLKLGYTATITGGILWAVAGICGQYLFDNKGLTSNWMVPIRLIISGLILLIVALIRGHKIFAPFKNLRDIVSLVIFAVFGMSLTQYGYFTSISASNAATGTMLSYLSPIFIIAYTTIRYRTLPRFRELISLILMISGTVLLATHGDFTSLAISPKALFWGIISSMGFALYNIQPVKIIKKYGTLPIVGWGMFIGGIILSLIFRPWYLQGTWDISATGVFMILIVFGTVMSFSLYLSGAQIIGPSRACLLSAVEPVFSTVFSFALLHTSFALLDIVGFVLILSTVFILATDTKPN